MAKEYPRCYLRCPMLNQYGFCESAMRKVDYVRGCPHDKLAQELQQRKREAGGS